MMKKTALPQAWNAFGYTRVSKDDRGKDESNSIKSQRDLILDFVERNPDINIVSIVADDGATGANFNRDAFKDMISRIENSTVDCVIVKDMSRVGRDHIIVGAFLEKLRVKGVRFIAIGNNIDSLNPESLEFAPFLNIIAEWQVRDTSCKIKQVLRNKGERGEHLTNAAIYGYIKSPDDKNKWLVDEEAATVVRRIFQMTIEGNGPYQIARALTDEKILRPSAYIAIRDNYDIPIPDSKYNWGGRSVQNILDKPEYMGHTVNFRSHKGYYKDKHRIAKPKDEWVTFENTQDPIVDELTWEAAQKCRVVRRRNNSLGETNPLTGLVYCADCKGLMHNHRSALAYKHDSKDSYQCNKSTTYPRKCTMHYIKTSVLRTLVLETIRTISAFVKENEAEFILLVREASEPIGEKAMKLKKRQLSKHQQRYIELDTLTKNIYEDLVREKLSQKRYDTLSHSYEQEQEDVERQILELETELAQFNENRDNIARFVEVVRKYTDIPELTPTILNEYIHKIEVHEGDNSSGRREQQVDIYLNFIGNISIPGQETEPEPFDPDEHRKGLYRAYYYRHRDKILAKNAEKRAKEKAAKLAAVPEKTPEEIATEQEARRERKKAYQREYQRKWQTKRREQKNADLLTTPKG